MVGLHIGKGPDGCACDSCVATGGKDHVYSARSPGDPPDYDNDIIDSPSDLTKHNHGPLSIKFERIDGNTTYIPAPEPKSKPLEDMTVPQLIAVAEDAEVDISGLKSKETMVAALKKAGIQ